MDVNINEEDLQSSIENLKDIDRNKTPGRQTKSKIKGRSQVIFKEPNKENVKPQHIVEAERWKNINNLKQLYKLGFILEKEYQERMCQLVDDLTGTSTNISTLSNKTQQLSPNGNNNNKEDIEEERIRQTITQTTIPASTQGKTYSESDLEEISVTHTTLTQTISLDSTPFAETEKSCLTNTEKQEIQFADLNPPDFQCDQDVYPAENAIKHIFEIDITGKKKWSHSNVKVKVARFPFSQGDTHLVYHMKEVNGMEGYDEGGIIKARTYAVKFDDLKDTVSASPFKKVEMYTICSSFARKYNMYIPPRKVQFVKAWVMEFVDRPDQPVCIVEPYVRKEKDDFTLDEERRDSNFDEYSFGLFAAITPDSFSHFSFEASNHTMIVDNMKSLGDLYSNPRLHTLNPKLDIEGNMGQKAFDNFFATHVCNDVCKYMKLPALQLDNLDPNSDSRSFRPSALSASSVGDFGGTIPSERYMKATKIKKIKFEHKHYYDQYINRRAEDGGIKDSLIDDRRKNMMDDDDSQCFFCNVM